MRLPHTILASPHCLSRAFGLICDVNKDGRETFLGCECHNYCANKFYCNTPQFEQLNDVVYFIFNCDIFSQGTILRQSIYNFFCSLLANKCFPKYNNIACRVQYFCIAEQNSVTRGKKKHVLDELNYHCFWL